MDDVLSAKLDPQALLAALEANHAHKSDPGRKGCGIEKAIRAYLASLPTVAVPGDNEVEAAAKALYEDDDIWSASMRPWPATDADAYRRLAAAALSAAAKVRAVRDDGEVARELRNYANVLRNTGASTMEYIGRIEDLAAALNATQEGK